MQLVVDKNVRRKLEVTMQIPEEKTEEIMALVCDHLCHFPFVCTQDQLDELCQTCPLEKLLKKEEL